MRSILLAMYGSDTAESGLQAAVHAARTFNSHIVGTYAQSLPQVFVGDSMGMGAAYVSDTTETWAEYEGKAHEAFDAFMKASKVRMGKPGKTATKPSASWLEPAKGRPAILGELGRIFDLIVMPRDDGVASDFAGLSEELLFETGKPVLISPATPPEKFGTSIVIAWNGSTETARLVALGLPFLKKAKEVNVLTIKGGTVSGPNAEAVAERLVLQGVNAQALTLPAKKRTVGEAILEETAALGADMLFKGAYTQSRLRQMIFGGATKHIIGNAQMPVLMAH